MENLQKIADDCTEEEIGIVKINDLDEAKTFGLDDKMPVILYFENKVTYFGKFRTLFVLYPRIYTVGAITTIFP